MGVVSFSGLLDLPGGRVSNRAEGAQKEYWARVSQLEQVRQQLGGGAVGPVQVVEHKHGGRALHLSPPDGQAGRKQLAFEGFALEAAFGRFCTFQEQCPEHLSGRLPLAGGKPGKRGRKPVAHDGNFIQFTDSPEQAQVLLELAVGTVCLVGDSSALSPVAALQVEGAVKFVDYAALAEAGLADKAHNPAAALTEVLQRFLECLHFLRATYQRC